MTADTTPEGIAALVGRINEWGLRKLAADVEATILALQSRLAAAEADVARLGTVNRKEAAMTLLDMLYMRNGAHDGIDAVEAQKIWDSAFREQGFAAVTAFLRAIGEGRSNG